MFEVFVDTTYENVFMVHIATSRTNIKVAHIYMSWFVTSWLF